MVVIIINSSRNSTIVNFFAFSSPRPLATAAGAAAGDDDADASVIPCWQNARHTLDRLGTFLKQGGGHNGNLDGNTSGSHDAGTQNSHKKK